MDWPNRSQSTLPSCLMHDKSRPPALRSSLDAIIPHFIQPSVSKIAHTPGNAIRKEENNLTAARDCNSVATANVRRVRRSIRPPRLINVAASDVAFAKFLMENYSCFSEKSKFFSLTQRKATRTFRVRNNLCDFAILFHEISKISTATTPIVSNSTLEMLQSVSYFGYLLSAKHLSFPFEFPMNA